MNETGENKNLFSAVAVSGGKDSSALLLLMIEREMPIDCVLYADTGMEFPEMAAHIAKLDDLLYRERGIHIASSQVPYPSPCRKGQRTGLAHSTAPPFPTKPEVRLCGGPDFRHPHGFEWMMFDAPLVKRSAIMRRLEKGLPRTGYGWPGVQVRWCTGQLKTHLIAKEVNRLKKGRNAVNFIGIAADEARRCKNDPQNRYPLVEWGITEAQALQICYDRGFDWGGLYEIYRRASCWCCPLQRIDELRKLRSHHPQLWARLREMDNRAREMYGPGPLGQFKKNWSVEQLEERFTREGKEAMP